MKKLILCFLLAIFSFNTNCGQQIKIGVFDIDSIVQVMPGYQTRVDGILQAYSEDSLSQEYAFYRNEYSLIEGGYRIDSALNKSQAIVDLKLQQRQQLAFQLINWNKIAENRIQQKRVFLARPFYDKVLTAHRKIVAANKYDLILKPNTYDPFTKVESVFVHVTKELAIKPPPELEAFDDQ